MVKWCGILCRATWVILLFSRYWKLDGNVVYPLLIQRKRITTVFITGSLHARIWGADHSVRKRNGIMTRQYRNVTIPASVTAPQHLSATLPVHIYSDNVKLVEELALSQANALGTQRTLRQIARETSI